MVKRQTNNNQKPLILGGQNNGQKTETHNNQKPLIEKGKTMVKRQRQTIIRSR